MVAAFIHSFFLSNVVAGELLKQLVPVKHLLHLLLIRVKSTARIKIEIHTAIAVLMADGDSIPKNLMSSLGS